MQKIKLKKVSNISAGGDSIKLKKNYEQKVAVKKLKK